MVEGWERWVHRNDYTIIYEVRHVGPEVEFKRVGSERIDGSARTSEWEQVYRRETQADRDERERSARVTAGEPGDGEPGDDGDGGA